MKGRALRRSWIQGLAWAVLAAVIPVSDVWADGPNFASVSGLEGGTASTVPATVQNGAAPPRLVAADGVRFPSPDGTARKTAPPDRSWALPPLPKPMAPAQAAPAAAQVLDRVGDSAVTTVGCATCGGFHGSLDGPVFDSGMGCADGSCVPGRKPCAAPFNERGTWAGLFCSNLYNSICCPDPCYQPRWDPGAYASFFADYARPRTVTRIRYDNLGGMLRPDRNQYWMQQFPPTSVRDKRFNVAATSARLQQVYLYQEAAGEKGSLFVEIPYRQVNFTNAGTQAGFSDLNFGIKSLLFDREILQVAFQFRTYTPTGNGNNNLGTGNFSLDPSILATLKLAPETFIQGQYGQWIPLGGQKELAGGIFYTYTSLNQVLFYTAPDSPVIGTLELDTWSFENGGYTQFKKKNNEYVYQSAGGGVTYFNLGPGLRWSICNKLDIGGSVTWPTTNDHWAKPWFRFEVRFLF